MTTDNARMTTAIPKTMKAWQFTNAVGGLPQAMKINNQAPVPTPTSNQHLIKVLAVGLNPVDYKMAENRLASAFAIAKPGIPGIDFAGSIVKPAAGSSLRRGQLVFGIGGTKPGDGRMLAEYGVVEKDSLLPLPKNMSPVEGATVGVAGLTALQSILPRAKKGDRIFINGGSSTTGMYGIQLSKACGINVTTCCSGKNVELCKSLGADEVIDYTQGPVLNSLKSEALKRKYDLVIDNVFADTGLYWKAHEYTKSGARFVVIAGSPSLRFISERLKMSLWPSFIGGGRRKAEGFLAQPKRDDLQQLVSWLENGQVKPIIDSQFSFENAPQAYEKLKTSRAVGKIIVNVSS